MKILEGSGTSNCFECNNKDKTNNYYVELGERRIVLCGKCLHTFKELIGALVAIR